MRLRSGAFGSGFSGWGEGHSVAIFIVSLEDVSVDLCRWLSRRLLQTTELHSQRSKSYKSCTVLV